MSKRRKSQKFPRLAARPAERGPVHFEWEDDALELFHAQLEQLPADLLKEKGDEGEPRPFLRKQSGKGKKAPQKPRKKRSLDVYTLDLHGLRLAEAEFAVDRFFAELLSSGSVLCRAKIVTGRGLHSGPEGGVLVAAMYDYVRRKYHDFIVSIDESPAACTLAGVPLRGFFFVTLMRRA